ncbi:CDT1-like protein a, chloroplastic [Typha angustifolia]|uniref:CDT1-like protein a, chloroplastic n=1 Tax=Typha angustifolia TaxID=59011 RepID=UPI003C2E694B
MEPLAPSQRSTRSTKKPPSSPLPPMKPSPAAVNDRNQIWTPEKPAHLPRRARNRSVAFSVKEVKQVALGLQRPEKGSVDRGRDLDGSDEDLLRVEQQLGAGSGADRSPSSSRPKTQIKLPEKYEILCEFFNSMESSIRLLRLKGSTTTFPNICTSIQHLTERRFTYGHLAQLMYILPEAISIKKVLLRDEATCCMKPELQVILQVEAIGKDTKGKGESRYSVLRKIFRERLVNFLKEHPEGDDIPEEQLPHPFSQAKPCILPSLPRVLTHLASVESSSNASSQQQSVMLSHMSQSFRQRFSQKLIPDSGKTPLAFVRGASSKDNNYASVPSPLKCAPELPILKKSLLNSPVSFSPSRTCGTITGDVKELVKAENDPLCESNVLEGTPAKLVSTPVRLMAATPEIQAPKRYCPSTVCDSPPLKKATKRTISFATPTKITKAKEEEQNRSLLSDDDDILSFLPETLLQSLREKEMKSLVDKEAGVADAVRREKLIACLPSMLDIIILIYQSMKRSVMTKQELIHKIIAGHSKIVDRGEVEEQLKMLQELVPDWISEKIACSGDVLCCVNMVSSPKEIRQRLVEASRKTTSLESGY